MICKSKKPTVILVTRKGNDRINCKPRIDEGCVPGAGPGYIRNSQVNKINNCVPGGGTGKPR